MRLIDAGDLERNARLIFSFLPFTMFKRVLKVIKSAPTVSTVQMSPVKIERYDNGQGRCPLCKTDIPFQVVNDKWAFEPYCPHCGVRMNLEDDAK